MSKREEIKKKEQLQLKLQAQFNQLDATVLSWLKPQSQSQAQSDSSIQQKEDQREFNNAIVVPFGKGLNMESENPVKVGQFLSATTTNNKDDDDIKKMKLKTKSATHNSRSLLALQTKIRNDQRTKGINKVSKPQDRYKQRQGGQNNNVAGGKGPVDNGSDSEEEEIVVMKSKKVNKSKRPF